MTLEWNTRAADAITEAAQTGIYEAAEALLDQAIEKTPVQDGILRASGRATQEGLDAAVSFNTPYAVKQHEELGYQHPNGGQAKYLEVPANSFAPMMEQIVAQAIVRETGL
ncbi:hypothetical protein [Rhodococcus sp. NPDC006774]|uniref:hypothetical protein n=1 Tax=Rhodococcus sp. NPDC006774 TaxID=3157186 RepID=UPI0034045B4E